MDRPNISRMCSTDVKQNFGRALEMAARGPVEIHRRGRTVAVMAPPSFTENDEVLERKLARSHQANVEAARLARHQQIAIRLLAEPHLAPALVARARQQVDRWERESLCSHDYVDMWRRLLALPSSELAVRMCGDLNGWGRALRQNSPWSGM